MRVRVRLALLATVSRMKLVNGLLFPGGAFAMREPHWNVGVARTRVPSQTLTPGTLFRILYEMVLGSRRVASGNRYGMLPKPAVFRFAAGLTASPVMHQFGSPPTIEQPSWWCMFRPNDPSMKVLVPSV